MMFYIKTCGSLLRLAFSFRPFCTELASMQSSFDRFKREIQGMTGDSIVSPDAIFCNNEVDLGSISCYGFDYDYTLAQYTRALDIFIYERARDLLVSNLQYHENVRQLPFNPKFAIRGLHYDVRNGLLMKVDAYNNIQLDTVYRGLTQVPAAEVVDIYNGNYVPKAMLIKAKEETQSMSQLLDLFVIPEMNLMANIIQFFLENEIDFDPAYLYQDVSRAVRSIHKSGQIHQEILKNLDKYIQPNPEMLKLLTMLKDHDKRLFIITNSDFNFINGGMEYLTKTKNWTDYFDVIVSNAKKPEFFISKNKPFRKLINGIPSWYRVRNFDSSGAYQEGNLEDFMKYTEWSAREIFYFGDHIYTDLSDVATTQGWKTGCIIRELKDEISVINRANYQKVLRSLLLLERLINTYQHVISNSAKAKLEYWTKLRQRLRSKTKSMFNPFFGSMFRSYSNATYFSQRISLYADLYTCSVTNLLKYPLNHRFYPIRQILPHEPRFDSIH